MLCHGGLAVFLSSGGKDDNLTAGCSLRTVGVSSSSVSSGVMTTILGVAKEPSWSS